MKHLAYKVRYRMIPGGKVHSENGTITARDPQARLDAKLRRDYLRVVSVRWTFADDPIKALYALGEPTACGESEASD